MTAITFDILARDHASAVNRKIGESFDALDTKVTRFGKHLAGAIGVGFGAEKIIEFGRESVDAFEKSERGQQRLADAFDRFPKLADTNRAALRRLNEEISNRTGFLTRDIAAGEANLAQFGLTGKQVEKIAPLLVDYADKTGRDIPEAATLLGRALLGNQRALKEIGITLPAVGKGAADVAKAHREAAASSTTLARAQEHLKIMEADLAAKRKVTAADELRYTDAQNAVRDAYAKNQAALANLRAEQDKASASGSVFDQVFSKVASKVGGFAEKDPGKAVRQLHKEFNDLEVDIGAQLLPKLLDLGHFLTGTFIPDLEATGRFLQRNEDVIVPLATVVGTLGGAIIVTNKATKIWEASSKAVTTWIKLLGGAAEKSAVKVAAEGAAAGEAAVANDGLATSAEGATVAMTTAGDTAVATAGKFGTLLGVAGRLSRLLADGSVLADPMLLPVLTNTQDPGPKGFGSASSQIRSLAGKFSYSGGRYFLGGTAITDPRLIGILGGQGSGVPGAPSAPGNEDDIQHRLAQQYPGLFADPFSSKNPVSAMNAQVALLNKALASIGQPTITNATGSSDLPNRLRQTLTSSEQAAKGTAKKTKDILAGLPQFAVGSGYGIAEGIAKGIREREQKALAAAKSLASKLQQQIGSIRSTISSFESGIVGTITGGAGLLNTGNQTAAGLVNFERHQASIAAAFRRNLAADARRGVAASYIAELAQAGPEQAGNIAAQLTKATVGQINALDRYAREIGASARATADLAARAYYAKQEKQLDALIAEQKATTKQIAQITSDLETLARTGHLQTTVRR
jgi:hypothetical protein